MPYVDLAGLSRFASRQKDQMEREYALLRDMQWTLTEKAGAVSFYPVGNSPLEATVDFLFTETGPAEGTKGPDNPSTISGVGSIQVTQTNKNLASQPYHTPTSVRQGVTWTVNADGSVTANGTATANSIFYVCGIASTNLRLPVGTKCFLSGCPSGGSYSSYFMRCSTGSGSTYISANDLGSGSVFTVSDSNSTVGIMIQITEGFTANNLVFYPQLEFGESKTEWEPFTRIRVTIPLGSTYYGGTIDLATGLMTVTMQYMVADSNAEIIWIGTNFVAWRFPAGLNCIGRAVGTEVCSHFPFSGAWDGSFAHFYATPSSGLYLANPNWTASTYRQYFTDQYNNGTPVTACYQLANPFTVQLSPTEILSLTQADKYTPRLNIVYTDAQAVQVGYVKSPICEEFELQQAVAAQGGNV